MGAHDRLEGRDDRLVDGRQGILAQELQQQLHAIARVGLDGVQRQAEAAGVGVPALDVVEPEQGPSGLGHAGIESQGVLPGGLGQVVPRHRRVGLALVEPDDRPGGARCRPGSAPDDRGPVAASDRPAQGDLRHQHVGPRHHRDSPADTRRSGAPPRRTAGPPASARGRPGSDRGGSAAGSRRAAAAATSARHPVARPICDGRGLPIVIAATPGSRVRPPRRPTGSTSAPMPPASRRQGPPPIVGQPPIALRLVAVAQHPIRLAQVVERLDRVGRPIGRPLEEVDRLVPLSAAHGQPAQVEADVGVVRVPALRLSPAPFRLVGRSLVRIGQPEQLHQRPHPPSRPAPAPGRPAPPRPGPSPSGPGPGCSRTASAAAASASASGSSARIRRPASTACS